MQRHGVQHLLMGGQACVFYGAAEFSRDVDFAIFASDENLGKLGIALQELKAEVIAVPPFEKQHLLRGHAVHFRCQASGAEGMRVDIMTRMRGVDPFPELWERRTTLLIDEIEIDLMSLPDLVQAKKTQRLKDWPMLQRLIEAHWFENHHDPTPQRLAFWLRECRSPEILIEIARRFPEIALSHQEFRPLLADAIHQDLESLEKSLESERLSIVAEDKAYWKPLREELEIMRTQARLGHHPK
jgi:hypothetical protein